MKQLALMFGLLVAVSWPAAAQQAKLSPADSAKSFKVADDLRFDLVLAEPIVKQPISMSFDERGRLWVVQYIQYPHPAGLKVLSRDQFWRVVYDKVPPPPPHNDRGLDRITIHEDTTGTGVFDKHTVFIDGLNIVTSIAFGRGGVWVLNPPYLLYYPTKDGGSAPARDPVVHLQGFGLEDTHSCANSLRWGPDGWLYGAHGSTVTSKITRPGVDEKPVQMIGQHIWRYHPETKRFEIFAEGGGNAFGLEIDAAGRVYSGHNGGDTHGFHYVQGGYYRKGFEKHGVLANPYSFGFFEAMKHNKAERFSHTFVINEAEGLPERYRGKLFAVEPLHGRVMLADIWPDRSSFQTKDVGPVVGSTDTWFRPVDIKPAPDGSIYVADFYEEKIAHLRHNEGTIDKDTGRIYRLAAKDATFHKPADLGKKSSKELVELLRSDNRWERQTALRLLGERKDTTVLPDLRAMLFDGNGQSALEALWVIHLIGGFDEALGLKSLDHPEPMVRAWAVRLLADDCRLGEQAFARVVDRTRSEPSVQVRSQWACSSKRLSAAEGLPIVKGLMTRDEDVADIHMPLLLWWSIESKCEKDREAVLDLFRDSGLWRHPMAEQVILPRLMKRFALAGSQKDYQTCVALFRLAPTKRHGELLLKPFEEAFKGRTIAGLPPELLNEIGKLGGGSIAFGVRQGTAEAIDKGLALLRDSKAPVPQRVELIEIFGEVQQPACVALLLKMLAANEPEAIKVAVLEALQAYPDEAIGAQVVEQLPAMSESLREVADAMLASRREWGKQLLLAVDAGKVSPESVKLATLRKLLLYHDERITELVHKHFGEVKGATTSQMFAQINRLAKMLSERKADPYAGKKLFTAKCATCHTLHGVGGSVGPDLTSYKRDDVPQLLLHVINPSAEIREGYESSVITTKSGRMLTGIVTEHNDRVVVLRTAEGQQVVQPKDGIDSMTVTGISIMPEGLLEGMKDQEICDLFAYLRSGQPLNEPKK
ncbi:MAG TPA: PVC-type heme-binding CxxCH protein [Gemmataceae bacterium]|jgi:putative heme-binding domain-containing protein|nr:PVC-type heme-binding CxxCH protein [Gemmataceae bacterium]